MTAQAQAQQRLHIQSKSKRSGLQLRVGESFTTGLGAKFTVVQRIEEESTYVLVHDASGEFYELKPYQNFRRI